MPIEVIIAQVELLARVGLIAVALYLGVLWVAAIWWTFHDVRKRSTDPWLHLAAIVLVIVFSFPGLLTYFVLRGPPD
jgi:hypothetical protein